MQENSDKQNILKIQDEWQKGFFDKLKELGVDQLNNQDNLLAINGDLSQQILNNKEEPIQNEENTLRGTVNDILKKKKKHKENKNQTIKLSEDQDSPKKSKLNSKQWKQDELKKFYKGLKTYGLNFQLISDYMKTKTMKQVRQKYNRECKKNKKLIDETLKYYDETGQKKARKIIKAKFNQLKRLNSNLQSQKSLEQLSQIPSNSYQLSKSESVNSAFDFMDQQIANICKKKMEEKENQNNSQENSKETK
ncbi:Myb-like DNA-binding domain protein (macronuclear) [Tetrahymena thermophila SB210]|uniref:Myb-like DNA-binding domain protein n=1 Tax=Tetrahymena thermophila (strain SB210) TaxID=312017 RepID=Q22MS7_TETTS|nr:Myb-like DNA-binding domain protein [Tetrahymena thermophila SB210]EAR86505.2 Myb-like DNA-binding domain protein [Tetrahymena thermophila SB210]|eukprot:XP_976943.2 Myb-like DNA-binding domain protein [Tetrahymena thermophila SB210]